LVVIINPAASAGMAQLLDLM